VRKKLIIATAAGVLTLGGVAVAVPVLADTDGETSVVDRIKSALSGLVEDGSLTQEQADEVATTLSDAGLGHGGHHGGDRIGLETAAEALGLTEAELRTALEPDGTSLADVAQDQGVDVGTLVDALVQAQQDRIAQAVEDGRLTQAEADERLADLEARVTERVNSDDLIRGHHGRGGPADD
jgi:polyhydroxyalkanoate synthesis regulator phasin